MEIAIPGDSTAAVLEGQLLIDIPAKAPFVVEPPKQLESSSSEKGSDNDETESQGTEKRSMDGEDDKETSERPAEDISSENDEIDASQSPSADELQREKRRERLAEYLKQDNPIVRLTGKIVEEPRSVKFSLFTQSFSKCATFTINIGLNIMEKKYQKLGIRGKNENALLYGVVSMLSNKMSKALQMHFLLKCLKIENFLKRCLKNLFAVKNYECF